MPRQFASWLIVLLALLDPLAAHARSNRFDVTHDATGYRIDASVDLEADATVIWQTLTDYENLPQFVPGIRSVRVLETLEDAGKQRLLIEQSGEFRFLFFARKIAVLLQVEQQPRSRIEARAVARPQMNTNAQEAGLNEFEGTYTLVPIAGGVRLEYRARFVPAFLLPPILGVIAVRRSMHAQFDAMLAEIDRRRRAAAAQEPAR